LAHLLVLILLFFTIQRYRSFLLQKSENRENNRLFGGYCFFLGFHVSVFKLFPESRKKDEIRRHADENLVMGAESVLRLPISVIDLIWEGNPTFQELNSRISIWIINDRLM
jgi:hypothetical protein